MITLIRSAIVVSAIALFLSACSRAPGRQHVLVSGPVHIAPNVAVTLTSPVPLLVPKYWNALCLQPSAPDALVSSAPSGHMSATGKQIVMKVYLRNAAGIEDTFERSIELGSSDGLWVCFEPNSHHHALHPPYEKVKIISSGDLELNAIKWHSSDK